MTLDSSLVGRSYPTVGSYQVGREKIQEFAAAIGDDDAVYRDPGAAQARGYAGVIAPPTFAIILSFRAQQALVNDPDLGLDFSQVLHGDQSFTHHRPIRAGDELATTLHIDGVRTMGGNDLLTVRCEITDVTGDPVTTARSMLVIRGSDGNQGR
ncbi:MAG: FAS1-like dehydratase domain-containing protein [Pseudonocardiaceae bacterium]